MALWLKQLGGIEIIRKHKRLALPESEEPYYHVKSNPH
jgi:hypothetical protein